MQTKSDAQLLREYAEHGSESAFGEFVARHTDLVYSAALRQVESPDLARDVAQSVFTDLARKARSLADKLADDASLVGWLYRSTRFATLTLLRDDYRRQARERQAMQQLNSACETSPDWDLVRPVLDEAMSNLSDEDRDALLLRFFKNQEFRSVGAALGVSDDAAQKRVSRALEKLRTELFRRGVTTTAAALTAALSTTGVQVAPAGLATMLASASLASVGTTAGSVSTVGMLALVTSAKTTTLIAAFGVLVFVGGAAVVFYKSNSDANSASAVSGETAALASPSDSGLLRPRRPTPAWDGADGKNESSLADALARLRTVLYNPNPVAWGAADPEMDEAMRAFGSGSKAAMPLLHEALKSEREQTARRAAYGLGLIGAPAREAAHDIVQMMRLHTSPSGANAGAVALARIGSVPEILPDLARMAKGNREARGNVFNFLPEIAGTNLQAVDQALRPLLQDSEAEVRRIGAQLLAATLRGQAGTDVVQMAIEWLKSGDDNLRHDGLGMLACAGLDDSKPIAHVTKTSLGGAADDATAALLEIVRNSQRADLRTNAMRLLIGLEPDLSQLDAATQAEIKKTAQLTEFTERLSASQATLPEIIAGLKQFPKAAPLAARVLIRMGAEARPALPALHEALAALAVSPDVTGAERRNSYYAREPVANAIQKIAPEQPKALFTQTDMRSVTQILRSPELRADAERRQKVYEAERSALAGPSGRVEMYFEATPEQVRRLLDALKMADQPTYEAVLSRVYKIDPNFVSMPGR